MKNYITLNDCVASLEAFVKNREWENYEKQKKLDELSGKAQKEQEEWDYWMAKYLKELGKN